MVVIKREMGRINAPVLRSMTFKVSGRYGSPVITQAKPRSQALVNTHSSRSTLTSSASTATTSTRGSTAVGTANKQGQTQSKGKGTASSTSSIGSQARAVNPGFSDKVWEALRMMKEDYRKKGWGFTYIPTWLLLHYARKGWGEAEIDGVGKIRLFPLSVSINASGVTRYGLVINGVPIYIKQYGSPRYARMEGGVVHSFSYGVPPDTYVFRVYTDDSSAVTRVCIGSKCKEIVGSGTVTFVVKVDGTIQ